jgi:hypothetical protein
MWPQLTMTFIAVITLASVLHLSYKRRDLMLCGYSDEECRPAIPIIRHCRCTALYCTALYYSVLCVLPHTPPTQPALFSSLAALPLDESLLRELSPRESQVVATVSGSLLFV